MFFTYLFLLLIINHITNGQHGFFTRKDVWEGQIFPSRVDVVVGENIFLRILNPVANQNLCTYRAPGGIDIEVPASGSAPPTAK